MSSYRRRLKSCPKFTSHCDLRWASGVKSPLPIFLLLGKTSPRSFERAAAGFERRQLVLLIRSVTHRVVRTKREIGQTKFLFHQGMCALTWRMSGGTKINFYHFPSLCAKSQRVCTVCGESAATSLLQAFTLWRLQY